VTVASDEPQTDAYAPAQIAQRIEQIGVAKARADALTLLVLAVLAGAFIALGALFYSVVVTGSELGFGITRLLGGLSFCLGLVLVVVAGAELFTGNNLIAMAWASGLVSHRGLLRNWGLVYAGNVVGALGTVALVYLSGLMDGPVGDTVLKIAQAKTALPPLQAFTRAILCNTLVCLAVWLVAGARSVTDKILAVIFPVTAFVAVGLEHSIANWFFLPLGLLLDAGHEMTAVAALQNLVVVSLGNIIGGSVLVAGVYWLAYLRPARHTDKTHRGTTP
jgi:formate/nitrite transporter